MSKAPKLIDRINANRDTINQMMADFSVPKRLQDLGWIPRQLRIEAECLTQFPKGMPKAERDMHLDSINMENLGTAWKYISSHQKTPIDNIQIRKIHSILAKNTGLPGGAYRRSYAYIERLQKDAPHHDTIIYKMNDIQYDILESGKNPLALAIDIHYHILEIQPFEDFNKRTARMIMNWILVQNGYRPILFNKVSDRENYMAALLAHANGDTKTYSHYMYECMLRTQKQIIQQLKHTRTF